MPVARCSREFAHVMCGERRAALRDRTFMYSVQARGWLFAIDRKPLGPAPFFTWPFCPWCGGSLPDEVSAVEQLLAKDWTGEDGG